jgi:hypothetical protein
MPKAQVVDLSEYAQNTQDQQEQPKEIEKAKEKEAKKEWFIVAGSFSQTNPNDDDDDAKGCQQCQS